MTLTREVVFSIEIVSLPVGGTITRIAWGNTIRRIVCRRVIPSAWAAWVWPSGTETSPWRMRLEAKYRPTIPHSKREFDAIELPSATARNATRAAATQRPGWRTGIALISSEGTGDAGLSRGGATASPRLVNATS